MMPQGGRHDKAAAKHLLAHALQQKADQQEKEVSPECADIVFKLQAAAQQVNTDDHRKSSKSRQKSEQVLREDVLLVESERPGAALLDHTGVEQHKNRSGSRRKEHDADIPGLHHESLQVAEHSSVIDCPFFSDLL